MNKKIMSFLLIFTMILTSTSTGFAANAEIKNDIKILQQIKNDEGEIIKEISEMQGTTYYFEKTDDYNMTITLSNNGNVGISKVENSNGSTVYSTQISAPKTLKSSTNLTLLDDIKKSVLNNEIPLTKTQQFKQVDVPLLKSAGAADLIGNALADEYGNEYYDKFIQGTTYNGVYAKVIGTQSFYMSKYTSWIINAGTAISIIMSLMGIPASIAGKIFVVLVSATGVASIVNDATGNKYYANVNYEKNVIIATENYYYAGKTIYSYAYSGDKNAALVYRSTNAHSNFDDNLQLLITGINNYLMY